MWPEDLLLSVVQLPPQTSAPAQSMQLMALLKRFSFDIMSVPLDLFSVE